MRDLQKTIDYVERGMLRGLERPLPARRTVPPPAPAPKSSIRAWHAPVSAATEVRYPEQLFKPKSRLAMTTMTVPTTTAAPPARTQLTVTVVQGKLKGAEIIECGLVA